MKNQLVSGHERRLDEIVKAMDQRNFPAQWPTWRFCPQCKARVLFSNRDGDLECIICGTVVYATRADGR